MSRSRKKYAISAITANAESEKFDKVQAHRAFRKKCKNLLKFNIDKLPYKLQEVSDNWCFHKDAKIPWEWWNTKGSLLFDVDEEFIKKQKRK